MDKRYQSEFLQLENNSIFNMLYDIRDNFVFTLYRCEQMKIFFKFMNRLNNY